MAHDIKEYTEFLRGLGTDKVPHAGDGMFLAHLIGVYRDLEEWGCDEDICLGGMFHSIYGTELFQKFSLPIERRGEVQELIGKRAERLGYLNSAMDRDSFDAILEGALRGDGARHLLDRFTGENIELDERELEDLCRIHLCDWLEQLPRGRMWDYRRETYRRLAEHFGGIACEAYDRVFAEEDDGAST